VGYVQIFRNGAIEAVDTYCLREGGRRGRPNSVPVFAFERETIAFCDRIYALQRRLAAAPPVAVFLSLLRVHGFILTSNLPRGLTPIDREHLLLPDLLVEDGDTPAYSFLHPAFDMIWQTVGEPRSPAYDASGKWCR
jgi:hypothetical protein